LSREVHATIGLATIVSPFEVGTEKSQSLQQKALTALTNSGLKVLPVQRLIDSDATAFEAARNLKAQDLDAVCLLYGTYADDTYATTVVEQVQAPFIIWGTNDFDTGSVAGAQQVSEVLSEIGSYYKLVFGNVDDRRTIDEVAMIARVAYAKRRLFNCRLGVVGYPRIKGQTQAAFDEIELRKKIGCRIVGIGMDLLRSEMQQIKEPEVRANWEQISRGITKVSVNARQIDEGVKAYLAMRKIVREKGLNAVAIEDWNELIGIPNLAFSLLNEEGVAAGCEADVHATLVLYLLSILTGRPAFHGELLGVLEHEDALLVAHYGAGAPSLADSKERISLEPDRSPSGGGVSVVFQVRTGPVTIASLTGRRGSYRMMIAPGESIQAPEVFHGGIVANVKFRVNYHQVLDKADGMSHHWMLGLGDVSSELMEYCRMTGIKPVFVG
jgi:L-arabinose isomerase